MRSSAIKRAAALRELADLGCHKAKAAELMGVSRNLISRICRDHSVQMPDGICKPHLKEWRDGIIRGMLRRGKSRVEVANHLGIGRSRLSQLLVDLHIDPPERPKRLSSHLTLRRACALREMSDLGRTQNQAAILLQVDPPRISQICKKFGVKMKDGRRGRPAWLAERILRDFGKPGMTSSIMTERYAASPKSVDVTINRLRKAGKLPVSQRC